jgi:hypothetical protein
MTYSKFNIIYRLQKWMDSVAGQTFLNYAYSWGAAIVILGTLFKLTHLPGANFFLFVGMGTEVFVFFISAFDRPFDKTVNGMELAKPSIPLPVQPTAENYMPLDEQIHGTDDGTDNGIIEKKRELLTAYAEQIAKVKEYNEKLTEVIFLASGMAKQMTSFNRMCIVLRKSIVNELEADKTA